VPRKGGTSPLASGGLTYAIRRAEQVASLQLRMGGDEGRGGRAKAVAPRRLGDRPGPSLRERGIELLWAAMGFAGALRARHEPASCLLGTVASVQRPGDAKVLKMAHAAREHGTRFPGVGELVVGHGTQAWQGGRYKRLLGQAAVQALVLDRASAQARSENSRR
jgi:hypothetical protein